MIAWTFEITVLESLLTYALAKVPLLVELFQPSSCDHSDSQKSGPVLPCRLDKLLPLAIKLLVIESDY